MDPTSALNQLKDVHLPPAISWWPLAWGWWLVMALIFLAISSSIVILGRRYRRWQAYRLAVDELDKLIAQYQQHRDANKAAMALSMLLKQLCFAYYPRDKIASLNQERWQQFLGEAPWSQALGELCYQKNSSFDFTRAFPDIRRCMKRLARNGNVQHV